MEPTAASMYDPHSVNHRTSLQGLTAHHSPHVNHGMHQYHTATANHVPVTNHVMSGAVPDVLKRDKDAIYG